jgi:hypothetical protein
LLARCDGLPENLFAEAGTSRKHLSEYTGMGVFVEQSTSTLPQAERREPSDGI